MRLKSFYLVIFFVILFHHSLLAQSDGRMERRLQHLFENGQYERCYQKAVRYNKNKPESPVPEYYISKVNIQKYADQRSSDANERRLFSDYIGYGESLPAKYYNWRNTGIDSLLARFYLEFDTIHLSDGYKKEPNFFLSNFQDTLSIFTYYFPSFQANKKQMQTAFQSKSDSLRWEIVRFAEKFMGVNYRYSGDKPETGFDCSGFTRYVYEHIGVELPHNAQKQSEFDGRIITLAEAKAGDLVFFGSSNKGGVRIRHAGIIYSVDRGEIKVIHCARGGVQVDCKLTDWELYWKDKVLFVKTLSPLD
ncbi:MAG: hypothetical protein COZ08_04020 [Bacteroidetes bacterium CG_4_10_14_3_um_filter_42_6]|nr:MAG: hypothetical protein COZ08_04020 [Bacteroidetes bacterium CG_4_10_14_3_um_filter_42_6]PJB54733.1 MAG: hypothetical protein CO098_20150 [Bacteroidetes bacterium CG_4_9_14_3_um_filter_41_19]